MMSPSRHCNRRWPHDSFPGFEVLMDGLNSYNQGVFSRPGAGADRRPIWPESPLRRKSHLPRRAAAMQPPFPRRCSWLLLACLAFGLHARTVLRADEQDRLKVGLQPDGRIVV